MCAVIKNRSLSLRKAFKYHDILGAIARKEIKKGIKRRGDFHIFHTVEFMTFVGVLGFVWTGFFYIFIGMVFHSLLDVIYMTYYHGLFRREFFLANWITRKLTSN
jgi:hypothetical protein